MLKHTEVCQLVRSVKRPVMRRILYVRNSKLDRTYLLKRMVIELKVV